MQKHLAVFVLPFDSSDSTVAATSVLTSFFQHCQLRQVSVTSFSNSPVADQEVIICGGTSIDEILDAGKILRETGARPVVLIDSFCADEARRRQLKVHLNQVRIQFTTVSELTAMLTLNGHYSYAYPKAGVSASVVVYFPRTGNVLLIVRKIEPFKGWLALPGGFLVAGQEDLPGCAVRELQEETGLRVKPSDLVHIDVRSNPSRDPREHVIDQGFLYLVEDEQISLNQMRAGDDAENLVLVPLSQALKTPLSGDYNQLLVTVAKLLGRDNVVPFERRNSTAAGPRVRRSLRRRSR